MKKIIQLLILIGILNSCGTTKNYLERKDKDKALQEAVQKLNKDATNESTLQAIPVLYSYIQQTHLTKVKSYSAGKDSSRWNNIIFEYQALQNAYYTIINSTPAFKTVKPQNYNLNLLEAKEAAAEQYYQLAQTILGNPGRNNANKAFDYFKISDNYIPGYKDVKSKIRQAYGRAVINVAIDSLQDNAFFSKSRWGIPGYNFSNEYFQQKLITDLQNTLSGSCYPARFYTEREARRNNIRVDWVVDLRLTKMNIPDLRSYTSTTSSTTQTFADPGPYSNDSTLGYIPNKPLYNTVSAELISTQYSMFVRAIVEVNIKDVTTGKKISFKTFKGKYEWHHDVDGYIGDSRAGIGKDLSLYSNNDDFDTPEMRDILENLYKKIYPQVKNNISFALN